MLLAPGEDWIQKIVAALRDDTDTTPEDDLEALWEWGEPERFAADPVSRLTTEPGERVEALKPLETFEQQPSGFNQRVTQQQAADIVKAEKEDPRLGHQIKEELKGEPLRDVQRFNTKNWMSKYSNGKIPIKALAKIEKGTHFMRPDAARAYKAMQRAMKKDLGHGFAITDSYRTYEQQVALKKIKPTLAATPGKSNHGWGIALDVNVNDSRVYNWLKKNGKKFGYNQPMSYEPWHWEYTGGFKGGKAGGRGVKKQARRRGGDGASMADPLNRIESADSMIFAPTVFGDLINEVSNPPQTKQEWRRKESSQKAKGLGFAPKRYRDLFVEAGEKYNIPARLLASMAKTESGFNSKAVSSAGAQGIMQIMPLHGLKNPYNPRANIMKGAQIFASYINAAKKHHLNNQTGTLRLALAMYNAGPNASDGVLQSRMRIYSDPILALFKGGR